MDGLRLRLATRSGSVRVTAARGATLQVTGGRTEEVGDGWTTIHPASNSTSIAITCPEGTDLTIGVASGSVTLRGQLGSVRVVSSSGRVHIDAATSVDIRCRSSTVEVGRCIDDCRVVTVNGRVSVDSAPVVDIHSVSGSVRVVQTGGGHVRTVSGSVEIGLASEPDLEVRTISSTVDVSVPRTMRPQRHLHSVSGRIRSDFPEGHDGRIAVNTVSGAIRVTSR